MEHLEALAQGDWNPSTEMCSQESDFMAQLLGNYSLPNEVPSSCDFDVSSSFSQENCYSGGSGILFPFTSNVSHQFFVADNSLMSMDYCLMGTKNDTSAIDALTTEVTEGDDFLNQDVCNDSTEPNYDRSQSVVNLQLGKEVAMPIPEQPKEDKINSPLQSKKRARVPGEFQRNERNVKLSKCSDVDEDAKDDNDRASRRRRQNSISCLSEDYSNASSSKSCGALNVNGKPRTSRGSATDPQSLYARKRRERINERLRILQKLVPNGTKVDISTMLEEAVQYVKFLQLQIKMLSSDELWMYAPIAYNGMDIGGLI